MVHSTLYRVELDLPETSFLENAFVSMFLYLLLLNHFNLNFWRYASSYLLCCYYSLWVSAILNHFGYPPPHLDQWQQRVSMTWGLPRNYSIRCITTLYEACQQSRVCQGPSHPSLPLSQLLCQFTRAMGENSLRLQKVGAQPQGRPFLLKWR